MDSVIKVSDIQKNNFKLTLKQKHYGLALLDDFGINRCTKYLNELIKDNVDIRDYLQAELWQNLLDHINKYDESTNKKSDNLENVLISIGSKTGLDLKTGKEVKV